MKKLKKTYIKPVIKDETYILTVSAAITQTNTSVAFAESTVLLAESTVRIQNVITRLSRWLFG
ncbi:MAG: hypothetical protein A2096_11075 [Spirochaetes bacterium GWF1_41_5]|nr:MAG: hypothetical protein A2096_11075 [Spirochaetes bacterium GWF1_41_5]HBE04082.1 hypothetical protein [Spirochaetia bacterium]